MRLIQAEPLKILYSLIGIAFLLYCGYVVVLLVMNMWQKAPKGEPPKADTSVEEKLFKDMTAGLEQDHDKISYGNLNGKPRQYEFHNAGEKAVPDSQNLCISCHGDIPHSQKKETRAFLNMHSFFMACETCHIRSDNRMNTKFVWYQKTTGQEMERIDLTHFNGHTLYKILPIQRDGTRLYDTEKMKQYVAQFKSNVTQMSPPDKQAALKVIHEPMTEVKTSVTCDECHKSDGDTTYLPFKQIGYPERRVNQLVGKEVVGMIDKYKKFYLPKFLVPNEEAEK